MGFLVVRITESKPSESKVKFMSFVQYEYEKVYKGFKEVVDSFNKVFAMRVASHSI